MTRSLVAARLESLRLGAPVGVGPLAVVSLHEKSPRPCERRYLTLDEALQAGAITVTEASSEGSVPHLAVKVPGELPVLLVEGELLVGGMPTGSFDAIRAKLGELLEGERASEHSNLPDHVRPPRGMRRAAEWNPLVSALPRA